MAEGVRRAESIAEEEVRRRQQCIFATLRGHKLLRHRPRAQPNLHDGASRRADPGYGDLRGSLESGNFILLVADLISPQSNKAAEIPLPF